MNLKQLKKLLKQANIPKDCYWINKKLPGNKYSKGDTLCLGFESGKWEVYYTERGVKLSLKSFKTESEACEYFYDWVLRSAWSSTPPRQ